MTKTETPAVVAAVDLGSNSFHLVVARIEHTQVRVVDRIREPVALAAGFDAKRALDADTQERALACLARFGQRLREMHPGSVRAVGTSALREAANARAFLTRAEGALGHPIEVVSGQEEARLIYAGVAHTQTGEPTAGVARRLVVDIGGGSTEFILGEGMTPKRMDSLRMGCVSFSQRFFPAGRLTEDAFQRAGVAARQELQSIVEIYRSRGWGRAIGSSGTILSAEQMLRELSPTEDGLSVRGLRRLIKAVVAAEHVSRLTMPGLKPERAAQIAGGLAILEAVLDSLGVERMETSNGALREGVLFDLLGRIRHEDVREPTVAAMMLRYHVEKSQADRVERTALDMQEQIAGAWQLEGETPRQFLQWAARLHEIGLSVSWSGYHKHSAYLVEHAEMPGFSRDDQRFLAAILLGHRRKLSREAFAELAGERRTLALHLCVLLRLAARLNRSRASTPLPELEVTAAKGRLTMRFPPAWLDAHPLTRADLAEEVEAFAAVGLQLRFE
jgi:exopolyphosphatase/guanosine-5'-triphosphate,3'-diphosphate pyrophosphatase